MCLGSFVCVRSPARYPSPNPLASIGPKLKPTPRHLLFNTTTEEVAIDVATNEPAPAKKKGSHGIVWTIK